MAQRSPVLYLGRKCSFGREIRLGMFVRARDMAANVMYYTMGGSAAFLRMLRMKIQMKMAFFLNTNIFVGAKKKSINRT